MTGRRVAISTQERNPRSTIIRSVFVALLAALPIMNGALGIIVGELAPYGGTVPGWVFGVLNGGIAVTAILLAILTKIMAFPGVNEWFRQHAAWLSPEDK